MLTWVPERAVFQRPRIAHGGAGIEWAGMESAHIFLVRHARPLAAEGGFLGSSDVALGDQGQAQARALATWLRGRHTVKTLLCSPLARARQTAESIAAALGMEPQYEEDLREIDFGAWEGLSFAQAEQRDPALVCRWLDDEAGFVFPGGEAIAAFHTRIARIAERLHNLDAPLAVCHGGVIRALLCRWLALPHSARLAFHPDHAALTVIRWHGETGVLQGFNQGPGGGIVG